MTDHTFAHLEDLVERAIKPVWASRKCKQMLRMELLAHVMDIFDEEFATLCDEQAALNQTLCRFGLADAIGCELQSSLSFVNRWLPFLFKENMMKPWLWWLALMAIFSGPAFILPALAKYRDEGELTLPFLIVGILITLAGLGLAGYGIKRRFAHPQ
jgi:hypothetical protein